MLTDQADPSYLGQGLSETVCLGSQYYKGTEFEKKKKIITYQF